MRIRRLGRLEVVRQRQHRAPALPSASLDRCWPSRRRTAARASLCRDIRRHRQRRDHRHRDDGSERQRHEPLAISFSIAHSSLLWRQVPGARLCLLRWPACAKVSGNTTETLRGGEHLRHARCEGARVRGAMVQCEGATVRGPHRDRGLETVDCGLETEDRRPRTEDHEIQRA